jgi:NADH-quinone oxidoreductase subunit A
MTDSLLPVFLTVCASVLVAGSLLAVGWLFGRPRRARVDTTPYECGVPPVDPIARHRFSVKFYLVAMVFILFDIEVAFLWPWAVTFRSFAEQKGFVLVEMVVFLGILVAGFLYLWWRGALEWD